MNDSKADRPHWFWEMLASVVTLGGYESSYEREHAEGGRIPPPPSRAGQVPIILSPGKLITDPDEAEALGLTADARRMRESADG